MSLLFPEAAHAFPEVGEKDLIADIGNYLVATHGKTDGTTGWQLTALNRITG